MEDVDTVFPAGDRNGFSETRFTVSSPKKDVRFILSTSSHKLPSPPSPPGLPSDKDVPLRISHGPVQLANFPVTGAVNCALFNPHTHTLVVVGPDGVVRFLSEDGQVIDERRIGYPVKNLIQVDDESTKYVGWVSGEPQLLVTTEDMKKTWSVVCAHPVVDVICCYTSVISADTKDVVSRWRKASTGCGLVLKQKLALLTQHHECPKSDTLVTCLAAGFEDKMCYAAVGQEVAAVDFYNGTVVYQHFVHNSRITAMVSLIQHKLLATGSKDGLIKVWSEDGELMCVFSGHSGTVITLALCPLPKTVMSSSLDRTVRFWKLDAIDEFSRLTVVSAVKAFLMGDSRTNQFFFVTDQAVTLWTVDELYTPLIVLRSPIQLVGSVSLEMPTPYLPLCLANRSALVINVVSGDIVSAVDVGVKFQDIVYCRTQDLLFMLVDDGFTIARVWCRDKMTKPKFWKVAGLADEALTCLMVYERSSRGIMSAEMDQSRMDTYHTALLFAGRVDGSISWLNTSACRTLGLVEGRSGAIVRLACSTSIGRMVSYGEEKMIELWQVLPSDDCVLVSLLCLRPQGDVAPHIAVAPHSLAVASANEGLLIYHFQMKRFISPLPQVISTGSIHHVAALDTLLLFATATKNKTICIWTECNELLRVISLDHVANSIAFSSWGGDIVFTFKLHVFRLSANRYLPKGLLLTSRKVMLRQLGLAEVIRTTSSLLPSVRCTSEDSINLEDAESQQTVCSTQDGRSVDFRSGHQMSSLKSYAESVAGILFPNVHRPAPMKQAHLIASRKGQGPQLVMPPSKHFFPMRTKSCASDCFYDTHNVRGGLIPNSVLIKILWPDDIDWMEKQTMPPPPIAEEPLQTEEETTQIIGRRLQELAFVRCLMPGIPKDSEHLQVVHVLFTRRPSALKEADISWLPSHEQKEILNTAGKDWKVIRVKVVYGLAAKATMSKASKVVYCSPEDNYAHLMPTKDKVIKFAPKILEETLALNLGARLGDSKLTCTSRLKHSSPSTSMTESKSIAKESDTKIRDTCSHRSLFPTDEDTLQIIAKSMKEFVKFLSRCTNAIRTRRCSKKEVAVALSMMGVRDPNGWLIEELEDWLRDVKTQLAGDKLTILCETIESWLKRWTVRYITHVLAMMKDLHRGHVSGHVRLSMVQLILEHSKGRLVNASSLKETTAVPLSAYNPSVGGHLSLAVTCPSTLDQSLVDTVTPVEVVNYFCEMCNDERRYYCEHGLFKSNLAPGQQLAICSDTKTLGATPTFKEVDQQNLFGPWPTGIHLPLKIANLLLFQDKSSQLPSELLSYQTCNKFFVPKKSFTR